MLRTDIGEDVNALQCTTDSATCCRNGVGGEIRAGDFHFPVSDATVPTMGLATDGYYRDRDSRLIRLHRQSTGTLTGRFRCNIPQASGSLDANLYINIGEKNISACIQHVCSYMYNLYFQSIVDILVSISPFGSNIVGDGYHLVCTVTVTGTTDQPTITWLDPMNNTISSGVVTTGSLSTLTFNPLAASHAGTYTCRARSTLIGAVLTEKIAITVHSECSCSCCILCTIYGIVSPILLMMT